MPTRIPSLSWTEELHFGPPSDLINLQEFHDHAIKLQETGRWPWFDFSSQGTLISDACKAVHGWEELNNESDDRKRSILEDCDTMDIAAPLSGILTSSKLVSLIESILTQSIVDISPAAKSLKKKSKAKEIAEDTETETLQSAIDNTQLKMWRLKPPATSFDRGTLFVGDQNALAAPQLTQHSIAETPISRDILLTITTYTRLRWHPFRFARDSQHVLSSTGILDDVWNCIPCHLKGRGAMPMEVEEEPEVSQSNFRPDKVVVGYSMETPELDHDPVVIVIEDIAYCDGSGWPDYADLLIKHLEIVPRSKADRQLSPYERSKSSQPLQRGEPLNLVALGSLSLRIGEPYWILHRGNCEHWFVIDEIRLQNPRDPVSGYPICIQRTPVQRPLCRICSKVPARFSILNDVRLGETPALLCKPCWDLLGPPPSKEGERAEDRVIVVPYNGE